MYFREAALSARSVRAYDKDARLIAYLRAEDDLRLDKTAFDEIRLQDFAARSNLRIDFQLKLLALRDGLEGPTLFLDTDTRVCATLEAAWKLLKRFDVLACHAPWRRRFRYENYEMPDFVSDAPDAFCELNTGVLFLADTPDTAALLDLWQKLYNKAPGSGDQYLFMHALYTSGCRAYVLPPEFNYRYRVPQFVSGEVRILHGHGEEIEQALQTVNRSLLPRTSIFEDSKVKLTITKNSPPKPKSAAKPAQ